jgi:hypothetical protein
MNASGSTAAQEMAAGTRPRRTGGQVAMDIIRFFAAPFITLGSLCLFPFIAVSQLRQAWRDRNEAS